jgi:hypothetical protein
MWSVKYTFLRRSVRHKQVKKTMSVAREGLRIINNFTAWRLSLHLPDHYLRSLVAEKSRMVVYALKTLGCSDDYTWHLLLARDKFFESRQWHFQFCGCDLDH